ncbi:unnamed protein product [Sphagnum troendelagicum]
MQSNAMQRNAMEELTYAVTRDWGFFARSPVCKGGPGNDDEGGGHEEEKEEEEQQRQQQRRRAILEEIRNEGGKRRRNAGLVTERAKICLVLGPAFGCTHW